MYYISKFCRICVQTDVKLFDLDTMDFDRVKLSEKLQVCTKMVVTRESLSTEICLQCLSKLRTSYQFLDMCRKSTKKLHGYYRTLLSKQDNQENIKNFVNTDLQVVVSPIRADGYCKISDVCEDPETPSTREKRKRITKEQRCSLLKRLLANPKQNKREYSKFSRKYSGYSKTSSESFIGGLKSIINFTRNYEFGVSLDKNSNYETTPLEKLRAFSDEFFRKDFSEFKNTILYIIENKDNLCDSGDSEDEDYFNIPCQEDKLQRENKDNLCDSGDSEDEDYFNIPCQEDKLQRVYEGTSNNFLHQCSLKDTEEDSKENIVKFEEVIVEPDIKIKTEMDYEEGECSMDNSYLESMQWKPEIKEESDSSEYPNTYPNCSSINSDYTVTNMDKVNSMMSLNNFVGNYQHKRTFSPNNVRCRTRQNPYINPLLRQQFLYRSFKCDKCSRYFKSPGYLKAHHSKVH